MGEVIKSVAVFKQIEEPAKQKSSIIQLDAAGRVETRQPRASIDSGRDNPFRPDGEIYKSADPIVDYYKHGANQSRAQSPTDSQLLLAGKGADSSKVKKQRRKSKGDSTGEQQKKSCWRRWLCCCCCCGCRKKTSKVAETSANSEPEAGKTSNIKTTLSDGKHFEPLNAKDSLKQTKIVVLKDNNSKDFLRSKDGNSKDSLTSSGHTKIR